jgi:hypothetical protein
MLRKILSMGIGFFLASSVVAAGYERLYPETVKGFWMPALAEHPVMGRTLHSVDDPETMREFAANLSAFAVPLRYNARGEIDIAAFETGLATARGLIREYHENGIAVLLTIEPAMGVGEPGRIPEGVAGREDFLSGYLALLERAVALAEEEGVEYFAPMNEPDYKLPARLLGLWSERMLAVVEQGFTGKIVHKGASPPFALPQEGDPLSLAGCDCVGISLVPWDADLERFREKVRETLRALVALAEEQGFEPMITEFGIWGPGAGLPQEVQMEAISIIFEEGQRAGIKAFSVFDSPLGCYPQVKGGAIERVVKRFFQSM